MNHTKEEQKEITKSATKLAKLFQIELTIKVFGNVIFHWIFPPQED